MERTKHATLKKLTFLENHFKLPLNKRKYECRQLSSLKTKEHTETDRLTGKDLLVKTVILTIHCIS
jgi:hypothetical protein